MLFSEARAWIGWRLAVGLALTVVVGLPVFCSCFDLLRHPEGWRAWWEWGRLLRLGAATAELAAGTVLIALPLGTAAAVLLYRTDMPLRRLGRFLTVLTLFVPLPLFSMAWQATLNRIGWLANDASQADRLAAIWIHAVAGLPWVILLVGRSLEWVEADLEEEALTVVGPWTVLRRVTLPRCRAALAAATLWLGLQAASEITVTDTLKVNTYAEEVYTQFALGDDVARAAAIAVSLPAVLGAWLLVWWAADRFDHALPPLWHRDKNPIRFSLGPWKWPVFAAAAVAVLFLLGVPLASLIWKTGQGDRYRPWSIQIVQDHLRIALKLRGRLLAESWATALVSGFLTAGLALLVCWLAAGSRRFRNWTFALLAAAWVLPGPVIGLGMKDAIRTLLDWTHSAWLRDLLYYGPSPVPLLWVNLVRFLAIAVAILWPVVRLIPLELHEAARLDGAGPAQDFRYLVLPLTAAVCWQAGIAVAALSLGELSAGKLAETPGSQNFAHEVFTLMHYGVTNDLAALGLLMVMSVAAAGAGTALFCWLWRKFKCDQRASFHVP